MWQPISLSELKELISQQLAECTHETRAQYVANAIAPQKWDLLPWGDDGGGFWVIAIFGNSVLWYNDIEDGFNTSSYIKEGAIEHYWCNQDMLHIALLGLSQSSPKLGAPNAFT